MGYTPRELSKVVESLGVYVCSGWFFKDKRKDGSVRIKFSLGRIDRLPGWTPPYRETYEQARLLLQEELGIPLSVQGAVIVGVVPTKEGST